MGNNKSTDAQKRAAKKYAQKVDHISLVAPKGTKEKISSMGEQVGPYINSLVEKDLKARHKDVLKGVRERIQRDTKLCETVADWHSAFSRLRNDFEDAVNGERAFEDYLAKVLGNEAVEKFARNITIPIFGDDVLRHMSAMDDFFEERDNCAWLDGDAVSSEVKRMVAAWNSPEYCAMEDYKYLAHLYSAAVLRCEQMEAAITDLLGEEAFNRLVSQGDYNKDNLYSAAMASTRSKERQSKFFLDWLAGRGIFAPDPEPSDVRDDIMRDGWNSPSSPPEDVTPVGMLLADGATRIGLYVPGNDSHQESWISSGRDYSRLVIGWQALEFERERPLNRFAERAYKNVLGTFPDKTTIEGNPDWKDSVSHKVNDAVTSCILSLLSVSSPPKQPEDAEMVKEACEAARGVASVMARTGACRRHQIWRMVSEEVEMSDEPRIQKVVWLACQRAGIVECLDGMVLLTDAGIVLSGESEPVPSVLKKGDDVDEDIFRQQRRLKVCEELFITSGTAEAMDSMVPLRLLTGEKVFAELFSAGGTEFMLAVADSGRFGDVVKAYLDSGCDLPLLVVVYGEDRDLRVSRYGKPIIVSIGCSSLPLALTINHKELIDAIKG